MIDSLNGVSARIADQRHTAQWAAQAGIAFALEKRDVDGAHALIDVQGRATTELVNALRHISQQLRP